MAFFISLPDSYQLHLRWGQEYPGICERAGSARRDIPPRWSGQVIGQYGWGKPNQCSLLLWVAVFRSRPKAVTFAGAGSNKPTLAKLEVVRLHIWSWGWLRSLEVTRGHTVWLWGYLVSQEDTVPVHRITGGQLRSHEVSLLRSHELFFYCKLISTAIRIRTFKSYSSTQIFLTNYKDLNECRLCTVYIRNNFF